MKAYIIELFDDLMDIGEVYIPRKVYLSAEKAQEAVDEYESETGALGERQWGRIIECEVVE